ncbi:MAG: AMP-dependent synthetase/ligase [Rhodothermales bacterium]
MTHTSAIIPDLVAEGLSKNTTGIVSATKRNGTWFTTSIEAFRDMTERCAFGLYALGLRRGDRVALHAENSTEWLIVDQAAQALGAVTVPIYTTQPGDQIKYILENSEARIYLVSTEALFASLRPFMGQIATLETTVGLRGTFHPGMLSLEELLDRGRQQQAETPELLHHLRAEITPEDVVTFIYTSGTTGFPKGVMLTHSNFVSNILAVLKRAPFDIEGLRGERVLSYLPLAHSFERTVSLLYLHIGCPIYFIENYEDILEDLRTVQPAHFTTVPRLLEKIYAGIRSKADQLSGVQKVLMGWALDLADRYDVEAPGTWSDRIAHALADRIVYKNIRRMFGSRLQTLTSGGAALSGQIMNFFNAIGIFCGQGYGMTETSPVISVFHRKELRAGSTGKPIDGIEVKIADDGEILTRGPHVMKGYFKMPEATCEVLTEDGWLHTGDIGHFDDDGYLYITDRKKQLLKLSTGKYVAPQPIEMALTASPFIEQAVVIGNECKFCSALLVLDAAAVRRHFEEQHPALPETGFAGHAPTIELIRKEVDAANATLPHWEQIKQFRLLEHPFSIESGELTPTMKVKRRVVQEKYKDKIALMYA